MCMLFGGRIILDFEFGCWCIQVPLTKFWLWPTSRAANHQKTFPTSYYPFQKTGFTYDFTADFHISDTINIEISTTTRWCPTILPSYTPLRNSRWNSSHWQMLLRLRSRIFQISAGSVVDDRHNGLTILTSSPFPCEWTKRQLLSIGSGVQDFLAKQYSECPGSQKDNHWMPPGVEEGEVYVWAFLYTQPGFFHRKSM